MLLDRSWIQMYDSFLHPVIRRVVAVRFDEKWCPVELDRDVVLLHVHGDISKHFWLHALHDMVLCDELPELRRW